MTMSQSFMSVMGEFSAHCSISKPGRTVPAKSWLILITEMRAKIYDWETLNEMSKSEGVDLQASSVPSLPLSNLVTSACGHNVCMIYLGSKTFDLAPALRLWPTSLLMPEVHNVKTTFCFDDLAKDIEGVIGVNKSLLVFLAHSGWVCSTNIDDVRQEKFYTRHFLVPLQWHGTLEKLSILVTFKESIVMAVNHEIAVFHNGLNFEKRVGFAGATVSGKVSMRSEGQIQLSVIVSSLFKSLGDSLLHEREVSHRDVPFPTSTIQKTHQHANWPGKLCFRLDGAEELDRQAIHISHYSLLNPRHIYEGAR